jgi:histidine triad (HIT) family protein
MIDCIFCAVAEGQAPSYRVAGSDRALAVLDINPAADGHTLVMPRAHASDIWELPIEDGRDMWSLTQEVASLLRERLRPDGMTLFQANGRAGWQDVFHFHLHVVPRWKDDQLVKPWHDALADPTDLESIVERLR